MSPRLIELTASLVERYLEKNAIEADRFPGLLRETYSALMEMETAALRHAEAPSTQETVSQAEIDTPSTTQVRSPAVPVEQSVTKTHLFCLECGLKTSMLKRHLRAAHGLEPAEYRARWGLSPDYPMSSEALSTRRSELAMEGGIASRKASSRTVKKGAKR